ncbi:hypothetical protein [Croceivirga sp. JEA036]|uniref:hypothetical protein n=1 Tax=Croceivirga sp. JEA036 TaxID=2721162 RepID=UPI00143943BF|nr:hypothetical protein [Croceivirga sp. JEA036]NJB37710.1 hypothetical protein [Croceivirga sp. JEA036]
MKQGEEKTEFVKEEHKDSKKYIFQKNTKTKVAFFFILSVLVLLILGVVVSGVSF